MRIKRKGVWCSSFLFVVVIAMAILLEARTELDLVKYYRWLDEYKEYSFQVLLQQSQINSVIIDIVFWLIAKSNIYILLPLITVSLVYGITLWLICDAESRLNIGGKRLYYYWLYFLSVLLFGFVISNIRNVIAFSLIEIAFYRDLFLRKRNVKTLFFYIFPCGIHISVLVLIFARLMLPVYQKLRWMGWLFILLIPCLVEKVFSWTQSWNSTNEFIVLFKRLIDKAYYYFFSFDQEWRFLVENSGFQKGLRIFTLLVILLFQTILFINTNEKANFPKIYWMMVEMIGFITLTSFYIPIPVYLRFEVLYLSLSIPVLMQAISLKSISRLLFWGSYLPVTFCGIIIQIYYIINNFKLSIL